MSTPSMSTSTEASAKILPNFTGLIERTVIETVLEEGMVRVIGRRFCH
jgi:hypothetical protein